MTGQYRETVIETRADFILASERTVAAYAVHFEAQLHRGKMCSLRDRLRDRCLHFARTSATLLAMTPESSYYSGFDIP